MFPGTLRERKGQDEIWVTPALKNALDFSARTGQIWKIVDHEVCFANHTSKSNLNAMAYYLGLKVDDNDVMKEMLEDMALFFKSVAKDPYLIDNALTRIVQERNLMQHRKRSSYQPDDEYYTHLFESSSMPCELLGRNQSVETFLSSDMSTRAKKKAKRHTHTEKMTL